MRLIDADKIEYMWKQDINGNFHDGVTLESIVDKTPTENVNDLIVKELEKIKDEILEHNRRYLSDDNAGLERAIWEFIEPHIEELKGEEKTGKWEADWSISCECPKYVCSVCGEAVWLKTDRCPKCKAIMKVDNK